MLIPNADCAWVVYCPAHRHYLVFAGTTGTTWTDDQAQARRFDTKPEATKAAASATWLDHDPTPRTIGRTGDSATDTDGTA